MSTNTVKKFQDAVLKIADGGGTGGSNVITMALSAGGLRYTTSTPKTVHKDRGSLSSGHARNAEEEPMEWSIEAEFRGYESTAGTAAEITPYEALTQTGEASGWVSDEPNSDVYGVILELTITDPGDSTTEVVTIERAFTETEDFAEAEEGDTLSFSGRAMVVRPTFS